MSSGIRVGGLSSPIWSSLRGSFFLEFTVIFALIALVVSLLAGFAVSSFVARDIRRETINDVSSFVEQVTARQIVTNLTPEHLAAPLTGEEFNAFDRFVRENVLSSRTVRVNVYNAGGLAVYSSYQPLLEQTSSPGEHLQEALQGETSPDIKDTGDGNLEHAGLERYGQVLEVYTPIRFGDSPEVVGAFEIDQDYGPIAAHIKSVQKSVYLGIGAALASIYLILLLVVKRGSNLIRSQQKDLQARSLELKGSYDSIVAVLCAALDLRDHVTHGHAQRVSELATVVAWQMGLRKEQVRQIAKAAILHDIGKIGVADAVLSKPGALTDQEWEEMRRHPELGYHILKDIDFLADVAEIVHAHHERYDGTGYPRGLKGDEIPLGARIFTVVDAYDAMTSHRPYRKAVPHAEAVAEIIRNSGIQFDPQVVKAFLEAERRGHIQSSPQALDEVDYLVAGVTRQGRPVSLASSEGDSQPDTSSAN